MLQLTLNPELTLTSFRTTRPCTMKRLLTNRNIFSRTSLMPPPKMSNPGGRLLEFRSYWVRILLHQHMVATGTSSKSIPSLPVEHGAIKNCRDLPHIICFIHVISQFQEKKIRQFPLRNFRLFYKTYYASFHSIICQVVACGRLRPSKNFKPLPPLKVFAVAYKRFQVQ